MKEKIGIIADDFTGANDTGVQLAKKGYHSSVMLEVENVALDESKDVTVVDTNSRALPEKDAYEAVHHAASFFLDNRITVLYKKVDSTLRGNIGPELEAMQEAVNPDIVVVAPAYPKMGRTTKDGNHYVEDRLVSETEFGKDPKTPVAESNIVQLIKPYSIGEVTNLTRNQLNTEDLETFINNKVGQNPHWFVCDAKSEEDLKKIAEKFAELPYKVVWVGSAGLIEYLPEGLSLESDTEIVGKEDIRIDRTLTVSGSLSEITKQQLLELATIDSVRMIEVDPLQILEGTLVDDSFLGREKEKKDLVVYVDNNEENRKAAMEFAEKNGLSKGEVGSKISKGLGQIAKRILSSASIDGLVLTGGDTAKDVCLAMNVVDMELLDEIETGVPLGRISFSDQKLWTITKAGGFGNKETLKNALYHMKGMKQTYDAK
ncbi:four-carbon acid sugar kinase family protein [Pseudalkalibacillus sp. A8]|uniref:four-carbon acid sugar kinase family protein n=1 Tax=Pseudalkalibacillus sp. A8 TaxID=3382641 RepID=UPI0038B61E19